MIALVIVFLCALYVLKIFLPEQFILVIENEQLIQLGNFIDQHWWLSEIIMFITACITHYIYLCAVLKCWYLKPIIVLEIAISVALMHVVYEFDVMLASALSTATMLVLPAINKAQLKEVTTVFTVHSIAQSLSISIRNLPMLLTNVNFMTTFILGLECYFWLLLFYLYYNYKNQEVNYG